MQKQLHDTSFFQTSHEKKNKYIHSNIYIDIEVHTHNHNTQVMNINTFMNKINCKHKVLPQKTNTHQI